MQKKAEIPDFILRQAQDERERFQWLGRYGELVEPWAASFFSNLVVARPTNRKHKLNNQGKLDSTLVNGMRIISVESIRRLAAPQKVRQIRKGKHNPIGAPTGAIKKVKTT
jgi:hypothetical protein